VEGSHRYYGTLMFAPQCEAVLRDSLYELLRIENPDRTPYMA
jgi:hypothetical protein